MIYKYNTPKIKILYTSLTGDRYILDNGEIGGDLLSLSTNKIMNQIAGTFEFSLVARKNLQNVINNLSQATPIKKGIPSAMKVFQATGLIDIYINEKEVMIGTVDSVTRTKIINSNGTPNFLYTVRGRDLGKFLEDYKMWFEKNPNKATKDKRLNNSLLGGYVYIQEIKKNTPQDILETIYNTYFTKILNKTISGVVDTPFTFVDGSKIEEKLTCSKKTGKGLAVSSYLDTFPLRFEAWSKEATLWDFLKSFTNPPFNEMFVDTGGTETSLRKGYTNKKLDPKKAHVIYRPCPFDDPKIERDSESLLDIEDLPSNEISEEEVFSENLTRGINNIPSVYRIFPMAGFVPTTQAGYIVEPKYDEKALRKYGYRQYEVALEGIDSKEKGAKATYLSISKKYQEKLYSWFRNNDLYMKGVISTIGREEIRIGTKLDYKTEDNEVGGYYYVTGVAHNYVFGQEFTTKLTVDRGVTRDIETEYRKKN